MCFRSLAATDQMLRSLCFERQEQLALNCEFQFSRCHCNGQLIATLPVQVTITSLIFITPLTVTLALRCQSLNSFHLQMCEHLWAYFCLALSITLRLNVKMNHVGVLELGVWGRGRD